ncbi:ABC transporter substrate-binding protein [Holospora curviuscula]|uniref:ABC transporter substrate binding protein n=1 Tax=Holospora curviuscula TaxID=1082868 RepID=A0A2S5RDI8_9PROT|nr:ABC transporter substrate-binding protein [Holospora curviuscula]PPE05367.1 ABC transporter substrate binding protein [Holospora curviuscula]
MNIILASALLELSTLSMQTAQSIKKVFIQKIIEHPALDQTTRGIIDGLEKNGYRQGINIEVCVESAQGNPSLALQIAAKFIGKEPDVVVGVATLAAQSFLKYVKEKKVNLVFSSITDPIEAKLVQKIDAPGNHTSGVSNFVSLTPQIQVFKKIYPGLKRLGFLYNPGEMNSLSLIKQLEALCPKLGIRLVLQTANKTSEVSQAATKLASQVDAIFISNDSTALSALKTIINVATKVKIPVYVSDTDAVHLGALAALGPNQYKIGLQTAQIIVRCLKGEDLSTIPVEFPKNTELYLNEAAAERIGIILPESLKAQAAKIIPRGGS